MQEIKSNSMKVAQRRRLAMFLSALTLGGAPTFGLLYAFAGSQESPSEGILGAVGIRYISTSTDSSTINAMDSTNRKVAPTNGSVVPVETSDSDAAHLSPGSLPVGQTKLAEPAMRWELPSHAEVSESLPATPELMTEAKLPIPTESNPNTSGSLTVNFGQPKRWVLPPVTVRADAPSGLVASSPTLPQSSAPEIAKPNPVAIGSLVAKSHETVRSRPVEIPTSLPSSEPLVPSAQQAPLGGETIRAYSLPNMVVNSPAPQVEQAPQEKMSVPIKWLNASYESTPQDASVGTLPTKADPVAQVSSNQPRLVGSYIDQLPQHAPQATESHGSIDSKSSNVKGPVAAVQGDIVLGNPSPLKTVQIQPTVVTKTVPPLEEVSNPPAVGSLEPDIAKKNAPSVARFAPKIVTVSPTPAETPAETEVEISKTVMPESMVKVAEPKLVSQEVANPKLEPQVNRLSPMILQQPEVPVVLNRVENPPIAAATIPTWESLSDQGVEDAPRADINSEIAIDVESHEPVAAVGNSEQIMEPIAPSVLASKETQSTITQPTTVESFPALPTAEIALLTLEKLEPVNNSSSQNLLTAIAGKAGAAAVYSLNDHSFHVTESNPGGLPSSGVIATQIPESTVTRSTITPPPEPVASAVPSAMSVGIAKVEMAVGERRSLRLAVPIANSEVADQKVCLIHKANAHELILQPLASGLTSITVWFRNPANGVDSQVVIMLEVREPVQEVAEIVVEDEPATRRVSMPSLVPQIPTPPASVIEPVVSNFDRSHQVQPQSTELAEAIRKAFPNTECELRWDSRGELHVHGRSPDDLTAKRLLSLVRQSYLVPVHDKILIEP